MADRYILYSAPRSGGVAVEAALTLIGATYDLIDAPTYDPGQAAAGDVILPANPMRQVPALVLPSGEVMTESAAILVRLGELHPEAALAPAADGGGGAPRRRGPSPRGVLAAAISVRTGLGPAVATSAAGS